MRVEEDIPRWDFPALKPPSPPPPQADLGALPSFSDFFGAVIISGFFVMVLYIGYRLFVMPEGKFLKIQRRYMK
jgi:hypothetical protein